MGVLASPYFHPFNLYFSIMEAPSFIPIKTYLSDAQFESPNAPAIFLSDVSNGEAVNKISIDVQTKANTDLSMYLIELHTTISPQLVSNGNDVFCLKLTYCSLIQITDNNIDDKSLRKLLMVDIPQSMYDPLRALVWDVTNASGFPGIMMGDFSFAERYSNQSIAKVESSSSPFCS